MKEFYAIISYLLIASFIGLLAKKIRWNFQILSNNKIYFLLLQVIAVINVIYLVKTSHFWTVATTDRNFIAFSMIVFYVSSMIVIAVFCISMIVITVFYVSMIVNLWLATVFLHQYKCDKCVSV